MQSVDVEHPVVAVVPHLPFAPQVVAASTPARLLLGHPPKVSAGVPGVHDPEYAQRFAVQVHVFAAHALPAAVPQ